MYGTPLAHPIDGDGLVCALTFADGKVHFRSRFVETYSHLKEKQERRLLFPGQMGTMVDGQRLGNYRDPSHTNVFHWGGKILTCHEYTFPHALEPGSLATLGQDDLNGALTRNKIRALSAHFRLDAAQDRLVTISFRGSPDSVGAPKLGFLEWDRDWNLMHEVVLREPGLLVELCIECCHF